MASKVFDKDPRRRADGAPKTHAESKRLPKLLYVSDVPVEASYHGSSLLYRLLQDYPVGDLLIIEPSPALSQPSRRLPGVEYRKLEIPVNRWRYSRFARLANMPMLWRSGIDAQVLLQQTRDFRAEAVLTVSYGYSWLIAAQAANHAAVPLHVILHDDWGPSMPTLLNLDKAKQRRFISVYRAAASRMCISPYMEDSYFRLCGVHGRVLYPSWAKGMASLPHPAESVRDRDGPLVGGYAGNITVKGYASLIGRLAEALGARGGKLLLFGPHSKESLARSGLTADNIVLQGMLPFEQLTKQLRERVNFVFVPMSFEHTQELNNMRIAFPSKIADYTLAGVPLLIWGPPYCTAVRWAGEYAPVAETVTSEGIDALSAALNRLERCDHRTMLGENARIVGTRLFLHDVAKQSFEQSLLTPIGNENTANS